MFYSEWREIPFWMEFQKTKTKSNSKNLWFAGDIGDWKNYFTVAMNETFDIIYADKMKNIEMDFEFEWYQKS